MGGVSGCAMPLIQCAHGRLSLDIPAVPMYPFFLQSHLDISDLPDEAKQVLQEFDTDNSGAIDLAELQLAAQAYKAQKEQNRLMKVALIFMAAFFALLCGTMAGLIYAVAEANKDTSASDGGAMTGKTSGTVVSTGSSETVNINGKQVRSLSCVARHALRLC